ncbi:DUF397 domain-containing protein [Sphaerisporangium sp. NPDC049003]|uniref:DUF397 domain-containing protein n=1 Tax=Sphaerisporangium sp. NPDC049003 TaxID=3364517 RepID=UPI0037153DF6
MAIDAESGARQSIGPSGPMLRFSSTEWQEFIHGVKTGADQRSSVAGDHALLR